MTRTINMLAFWYNENNYIQKSKRRKLKPFGWIDTVYIYGIKLLVNIFAFHDSRCKQILSTWLNPIGEHVVFALHRCACNYTRHQSYWFIGLALTQYSKYSLLPNAKRALCYFFIEIVDDFYDNVITLIIFVFFFKKLFLYYIF